MIKFAISLLLVLPSMYECQFPRINNIFVIEKLTGNSLADCIPGVKYPNCDRLENPEFRTLDGTCNNRRNPLLGAKDTPLFRIQAARYFDEDRLGVPAGFPTLSSFNRFPTPQEVSESLFRSDAIDRNNGDQSLLYMVFGQFIDHDISITENREERFLPRCNSRRNPFADFRHPRFPMFNTRDQTDGCLRFSRSSALCQPRFKPRTVRELPNEITSFVDASQVYGSSEEELDVLLENNGFLLRVSQGKKSGDLLPTINQPQCVNNQCFLAGDIRSSEHVGLSTMHTLFVREHNRIARELKGINPRWSNKKLFDVTRKIIGGIMQKIVYDEYVPRIATLPTYKVYDPTVNPTIIDGFSTAAFRYGHTLIKNSWTRLDKNFNEADPNVPLRQTFFNITNIVNGGIEPYMFGLIGNNTNAVDRRFASDILENLFTDLDPAFRNVIENLAARNIHRGRDHGLQGYNAWRRFCGLSRSSTFEGLVDIPSRLRTLLKQLYRSPNDIDLFAGGIIERVRPGRLVGPLFECLIRQQFQNLRDGDRFFYKNPNVFTARQLEEIEKASLSRVLCNNLEGIVSIQTDPFEPFKRSDTRPSCGSTKIAKLNLRVFSN